MSRNSGGSSCPAFIAEVDRRLEAEPDLDAKVNLLREAAGEYPDEAHFARLLTLFESKRELVDSIVERARVHEEQRPHSGGAQRPRNAPDDLRRVPGPQVREGAAAEASRAADARRSEGTLDPTGRSAARERQLLSRDRVSNTVPEPKAPPLLLLAAPLSRSRWLGANVFVAALSAAVVSGTAGVCAAIGLGLSGTANGPAGSVVQAALAHVPAALVFLAAAAVVFAVAPRVSVLSGWGMLAVGLVLGEFGELFGLPVWLQDVSPFRHSSAMPVEPFDPAGALGLAVVAAALAALSAYFIQRRDLTS